METFALKMIHTVDRWQIPSSRFVEYDWRDELWARPLGYGELVKETRTTVLPRCVVTSMDVNTGEVKLEALPTPCAELTVQF